MGSEMMGPELGFLIIFGYFMLFLGVLAFLAFFGDSIV